MSKLAEHAWNLSKADADPSYANITDNGFKENLDFRAEKVKETGIAITPFEVMALGLLDAPEEEVAVEEAVIEVAEDVKEPVKSTKAKAKAKK